MTRKTSEKNIKRQFTDWLYDTYDISFLPKYFFYNLEKVYKGEYKNLKKPVPVEDLWDMWQRKLPYLRKIYDKNKRSGKEMEGICRINYDMAIVLSRYDSYLQWKEQQQIALNNEQNQSQNNKEKINYAHIESYSDENDDEIDISEILEEI